MIPSARRQWLASRLLGILLLGTLWGFTLLGAPAAAGDLTGELRGLFRPYGIAKRIPWTTSRVVGSPEPPLPYRTRRAFEKLSFKQPMYLTRLPDTDQLLLVHHGGGYAGPSALVLFADRQDVETTETMLELNRLVFGVTFHPQFAENGYMFVGSNGPDSEPVDKLDRVSRFTVERQAPYRCDPKSELVILEWPSNGHNGADLGFGPDGMLYVTAGDGTSDSDTNNTGQGLNDLLATMIRIDVDHPAPGQAYAIPPDNPFIDRPGARGEIWAYGFRNPWKLTFDRENGNLWVGNNGQDLWEQVFLVHRGDNFGWSVYEGSHPFRLERQMGPDPLVKPAAEHPHSEARSLTGGMVYYGEKLPELRGAYIYGDYSTGKIWGIKHDGQQTVWHRELADTSHALVHFGETPDGELLIVDHGGTLHTLEPTPTDLPSPPFPRRLSETGLFSSVAGHRVDPALIPYSVNAPLWSDGAHKERFLALPGESQMDFTPSRGWTCPEGTVLVKTFSLDMEQGNPASRRRIETRLLTRQQGEWVGYSYEWNDEQTDATLVEAAGRDRTFDLQDATQPEGVLKQAWRYPSRAECMVCHSRAANYVLGLTELQMNKVHDYGGVQDNQLRTLAHLGVLRFNAVEAIQQTRESWRGRLTRPIAAADSALAPTARALARATWPRAAELAKGRVTAAWLLAPKSWRVAAGLYSASWEKAEQKVRSETQHTTRLPKPADEFRRLVDPYDPAQNLNDRARSYLHANCSQCHVEAGGGNSNMLLEFTTETKLTNIFDVPPVHHHLGLTNARLVAPGSPDRSLLLKRIALRGQGQMPPLASTQVDRAAVELLRAWIAELPPPAVAEAAEIRGQDGQIAEAKD